MGIGQAKRVDGRTIRQRARALLEIAHPDFRAELEQQAIEYKYL
jgi:acyl-CoA hydrolase